MVLCHAAILRYSHTAILANNSVRTFASQILPETASIPVSARTVCYQRYHAKRGKLILYGINDIVGREGMTRVFFLTLA